MLILIKMQFLLYRHLTDFHFCYVVAPIFDGEFRAFFSKEYGTKKIQWTTNIPKNWHVKNEVVLWPLSSSKTIVLVAQPTFTDGGPPLTFFHLHQAVSWCERGRAGNFYLAHRLSKHFKKPVKLRLLNKEAISLGLLYIKKIYTISSFRWAIWEKSRKLISREKGRLKIQGQ